MKNPLLLILIVFITLISGCTEPGTDGSNAERSPIQFNVALSTEAVEAVKALGLQTPIKGRAYVVISRNEEREPREQIRVNGVPFWGKNVQDLIGESVIHFSANDNAIRGFPIESLGEFPSGEYYVQAFLSVYTTFNRKDGHTVELHLNSGAGQDIWEAPGNVYSDVVKIQFDGQKRSTFDLKLSNVIPPVEPLKEGDVLQQGNPPDSKYVRFVKIKSDVLSEFWGHPMYIGANVLLPEGYEENSSDSYPVIYLQGHFPGRRAPFGFQEGNPGQRRSKGLAEYWMSADSPKMIAVTIRDANPYYDTSYSVNSENVGPYGDAITKELIPFLEKEFRMIPDSWARVLAGGSTGGWEALAMQIFYPDLFGGAWGWCPDPVDFNHYQIVNIYEDENAYVTRNEWHEIERPNARRFDGNIVSTVRQENYLEYATAPDSRSGGQWAIWEAVFGPVGDNGYPRPIWDPVTGEIDKETAAHWKANYDLHEYARTKWETIGPDLTGKLHIATGDMDTYYLDNAVYVFEEFLNTIENPRSDAQVEYGRRKPHCWIGESPVRPGEDITYVEFLDVVAEHIKQNAPAVSGLKGF